MTILWLLVAVLVVAAVGLAVAVSQPRPPAVSSPAPPPSPESAVPPVDTKALERLAREAFTVAVDESVGTFRKDLSLTSKRLNELIIRITTDVVERELDTYKDSLAAARKSALQSLGDMQTAVARKQEELEGGIATALANRQKELLERLDAKLGAAAAAYIVESLGVKADLGAQKAYLLETLERHKEELKREVLDGRSAG